MVSKKIEASPGCIVEGVELPPEVCMGLDEVGGLKALEKLIPKGKQVAAFARHHKALSDEIRLRLLYALALTDMCPCILKTISGTSDSKLSYHLKLLESEGLIVAKRVKNWRIYSITDNGRKSLRLWKG